MIITPTEEQTGLQQRWLIDVPWINISNFLLSVCIWIRMVFSKHLTHQA